MSSLRINNRLTIAFVTIIVLFLIGGGLGLRQLQVVSSNTSQITHLDTQANTVLRAYNNSLRLHELLYKVDRAETPLDDSEIDALGAELIDSIHSAIAALAPNPTYAQRNKEHLDQLESILFALPTTLDQFKLAVNQGDSDVRQALRNEFNDNVRVISIVVQEIDADIAAEREATFARAQQAQTGAMVTILSTVALTTLAAILLSIIIVRSIAHPLGLIDQAAQAWAKGDISSRVDIDGDDELANLGRVFNEGANRLSNIYLNQEKLVQKRTAELQARAMQLETSAALSQRIASLLDVNLLLQEAANLIKENFALDYVGVFLVDGNSDHLLLRADSSGNSAPIRLPRDESNLIGWVAANYQPQLISNKKEQQQPQHRSHRADSQTELAIPLVMGGDLLGVLDFQCIEADRIIERDIPVFLGLAAQISIAINNASIYKEEQTQRQFAELLQNIGRDLNSTLDKSEVLDLILARVKTVIPYDRASILLWNGGELEIQAAAGFPSDSSPLQTKVPIESGDQDDVFVRIYHSKKPLIINRVAEYSTWSGVDNIAPPGSWLGVPLIRNNAVIGMLSLTHMDENLYSLKDAEMATALASHAAVAVANAQYYMQIKAFNEQLEYEVQNRTHALRDAYEQLERLDSTKESFISVASHELRTPITVVKGYSQLLLKDPALQQNNHYTNLLNGMIKGVNRMHEIIDTMLDMAKIDGRTLRVFAEPISIYNIIQHEILDELADALDERDIQVIIEPDMLRLPSIEADRDGLKKIFYHLIINAIKYTPDGGTITIDGWAWHTGVDRADWPDQGVKVQIQDTGIGIDPLALESIFHKFYQTGEVSLHSSGKTKFKGGGSGLGLAIVKGIVETHQGLVWAESPKHDEATLPGSIFHIVLPLSQSKNLLALKIDDLKL